MSTQKKVDKVLKIARERVMDEVGSLLGVGFDLSESLNQITTKTDYFAELNGKKIVAKVDIKGEIEGSGGIIISVKDAIRLGGTLIMLPAAELDQVVGSENYSEEIEDSYGEIANIIAGSFTKAFEDSFPKDCRFIRKEQEVIVPLKVESSSPEPVPDQDYYLVRSTMKLADQEMGEIDLLLPAAQFGVGVETETIGDQADNSPAEEVVADKTAETTNVDALNDPSEESAADQPDHGSVDTTSDTVIQQPGLSVKELEKKRKSIDKLLNSSAELLATETGGLLGAEIKLTDTQNTYISKEGFFQEEAEGRQVLARMDIGGASSGEGYLFVSLKDAIRIGSILIMLPPSEMESAVNEEEFTEDCKDAYGEIANIIAGSYTTVFQEQHSESLRFVKKETEIIHPLKIDCEGDDVIAQQEYYLSMSNLEIAGKSCGKICLLLPSTLLGLAQESVDSPSEAVQTVQPTDVSDNRVLNENSTIEDVGDTTGTQEHVDILIIENNGTEADKIMTELNTISITARKISFNDSINDHLSVGLKLVIIVMAEVDEQAYGIAIKLRAMKPIPIIAAGSEWTRSRVIKAVKYGVTDILLTPSSGEEIREKVNYNMVQMAA